MHRTREGDDASRSGMPPSHAQVLARALDQRHGSPLATVGELARRPATTARTVGYLARLPTVSVELSDGPAGDQIRSLLSARTFNLLPTGRYAQAVLSLADARDASTGRSNQALRTNLRRGHALGLAAHRVPEVDCLVEVIRDVESQRGPEHSDGAAAVSIDPRIHQGYVVTDPRGRPEGYLLLAVDTHVAWVLRSMGAHPGNGAALCHYLLHAAAVRDLVDGKVRHLLADGALSVSNGVGYLQRRLGYRVCNVRIG